MAGRLIVDEELDKAAFNPFAPAKHDHRTLRTSIVLASPLILLPLFRAGEGYAGHITLIPQL